MGVRKIKQPAVFLDRDGVLNEAPVVRGVPSSPTTLQEFQWTPDAKASLQRLHKAGWLLIVVTNQPEVPRGKVTLENLEKIHQFMRKETPVKDIFSCVHDDKDDCGCRKPKPGMLLAAAEKWQIDLSRSWMVGDRWKDVQAGKTAGCRTILIQADYSQPEKCPPDHAVSTLTQAADIILTQAKR